MERALGFAAVFGVPCTAFVPQASVRSQAAGKAEDQFLQSVQQPAASTTLPSVPATIAAFGVAAAAAAGAATVGASTRVRKTQSVARKVVGVTLPLTEKWDPLNLGSTDAKMDRYTAVEIKHGRICMLATIGYVMPEIFRFPGCEGFKHGLAALGSIPFEGWIQLVLFLGAHEILVKPREGGMGPYDFGLGTELLDGIPGEELERRQTVERNNGRLAMVGIMGLMVQDGMFGQTPISLLKEGGWWGPSVDYIIKDIPICAGPAGCALGSRRRGPGLTAMRATVYKESNPYAVPEPKMSPAVPFLKYREELEGWVGGEKGFDPLNVTMALPVYMVREAELKHGRVCMLATIGWIATDLGVRFPGPVFQDVSTLQAHDVFVKNGYMGIFLAFIGCLELYGGYLFFEGFEQNINRDAGDFFLGKNFLPKDEEGAKQMKLKELENGRLAMLAFSGIVTQAALFPEKTWPFL